MLTLITKSKPFKQESLVNNSVNSQSLLKSQPSTNWHPTLQSTLTSKTLLTQNYFHWTQTVSLTSKGCKLHSNQKGSSVIMPQSDFM